MNIWEKFLVVAFVLALVWVIQRTRGENRLKEMTDANADATTERLRREMNANRRGK